MARTDIHRPSAIKPDEYAFVAYGYMGPDSPDYALHQRQLLNKHMERTGGKFSRHEHGGTCHICGAHALYTARFYHEKTNSYITTGLDCADKMDMALDGDPDLFRKTVRAGLAAIAGKRKAKLYCEEVLNTPEIWTFFEAGWQEEYGPRREEPIIFSMIDNLIKYGSLSDKQQALIKRLWEGIKVRDQKRAERATENAGSRFIGEVGERRSFNLTLKFRTSFETMLGTSFLSGFNDENGNVVIHIGTPIFSSLEIGDSCVVVARIKKHNEREGVKQTVITRPKIKE